MQVVFLLGEGVDDPADPVDVAGDLQGRALPRALEQHVLEEVRESLLSRELVPGAVEEPVPDAEGVGAVNRLEEQARSARQSFR